MRPVWKAAVVWGMWAVIGWCLAAPPAPAEPKKVAAVEGITEYHLENGLRLLLFPDDSRPQFTVNLTVFVGSRHEGYGETGMAHLLEHMLFKGSTKFPKVDKVLREKTTSYNGTTWVDRTNYFETLPAGDENLKFAIEFEADRLVNCFIRREDLAAEMTVVRNEFESGENNPGRVLSQRIWAAAFEWHNYGKSTIGNRSDIERVPIDNLQAFYKKWYQPDNAMLIIAGKFDQKKALEYVQQYFGSIPKPSRKLEHTYTEEPPQDGERIVTLRRTGGVGLVGLAYHIPAGRHPDYPALHVLTMILDHVPSGRFYQGLVKTKKATTVGSTAYGLHDPGLLQITAEVPKDGSLEAVRDGIIAILDEVAARGVTEDEVTRAIRNFQTNFERQLANTSQLAVGLSNWAAQGDWRLFFLHRDRVERVTPRDVQRVAAAYLQKNNRTVGFFIPTEKPERVAIPAAPDAGTLVQDYKGRDLIAPGELFDPTPENIEKRAVYASLPEGIQAVFLPKKNKGDLVFCRLTLRYGDRESLKGLQTASDLLPALMMRGSKKYSHDQLREALEKLGASMNASGGRGTLSFAIHCKREKLPAVLEILHDLLRNPALHADEFEILKKRLLTNLERGRTDPGTLAANSLARALAPYPKDDFRYVPTLDEEIDRVKAASLEQVEKLYKDFLGAQAGELVIIGEFDKEKCLACLHHTLKGWKAAKPYARITNDVPNNIEPGRHLIRTPDKANAVFQAAMLLPINASHADYPALLMANYLLGSGPGSRLWDRIREREGLSYGVGSSFSASARDDYARFALNAICNPENIGKVQQAMLDEIERFLKDGPAKEELDKARQSFLQRQKALRANDAMLAATLAGNLFEGRNMDYQAELEKKIAALTPELVHAAFKKHIDPKRLVIVHAGDFP